MPLNNICFDFSEAQNLLTKFIADENNFKSIQKASETIANAFTQNKKLLTCGNGGSMTDAMHLAEELSGKFRNDRKPLPAIAIADPSYLTCTANDLGFENIFSRFIESLGNTGDVLVAISTSGNSPNIIKAAEVSKLKGMQVIGLTGKDGGKLSALCDVEIRVPHFGYSDRIQEIHIIIIHSIVNYIENKLNLSLNSNS